jgi:5-formyltetrahydrofolate cyclo-ligase
METPDAPVSPPPLPPPPLAEGKRALRAWALTVRPNVRAGRGAALDEAVRAAISASPHFQDALTVGLYLAMENEIDLEPLIGPGRRFVVPRTQRAATPYLTFHDLSAGTETRFWGLREPVANAPQVEPAQIDLMLVPGLMFDEQGGRLGYGKGFYDRFLAGSGAGVTVGVTLDAFVVPRLPVDPHDVAVQYLVTESGLRRARR